MWYYVEGLHSLEIMGLIGLRGVVHRLVVIFCLFCLMIVPETAVMAKGKKAMNMKQQGTSPTIWKGEADEARLLLFDASGLYWEVDVEGEGDDYKEIIYQYDGNTIKEVDDLRGYEFGSVEQDGIRVWMESTGQYWGNFRLYAKVDGKKKFLADLDDPAFQIQIQYPIISWQASEEHWNYKLVSYQYDLETGKLSSTESFGLLNDMVYKSAQPWSEYMRAFEVKEFEYGGYSSWNATANHFVWNEMSGIYMDSVGKKDGFLQISDQPDSNSILSVDEQYVTWQNRHGLGIYSFHDNRSYQIDSKDFEFEKASALSYDGKVCILAETSEGFELQLFSIDELLHKYPSGNIEDFEPKAISPHYVNGVQALLNSEPQNIAASGKYLAWTKFDYDGWSNAILFKKINESKIYFIPGEWKQVAFMGEDLYALGSKNSEDKDRYDDDEEDRVGIYRINLETGDTELVYSLAEDEEDDDYDEDVDLMVSNFRADSKYLYWFQPQDESIVRFDPVEKTEALIDLGTDDVVAWDLRDSQVVWVEERKREYLMMMKKDGEEEQVLTRWATKDGKTEAVSFDGTRVAWTVNGNKQSKVMMYDLGKKKEKTIYTGKKILSTPVSIVDGSIYFIEDLSYDGSRLMRYDLKTNKTASFGNEVSNFVVQGTNLYYVDEDPHTDEVYYLLNKKAKSKGGINLTYKWSELAKNNQQKWYDIRYSFLPADITVTIGDDEYSWDQLLEDQNKWLDALEEMPDQITVSVSM